MSLSFLPSGDSGTFVIVKPIQKLPYYARSLRALSRVATNRSIARCMFPGQRRLDLRDGRSIRLSAPIDLLVVKETLCDDVYRVNDLDAPDGIVVDVGAGIGEFTLMVASRSPRYTIVSYEPNPHTFRLLEGNVAAFGYRNVVLAPVAVGSEDSYRLHGIRSGPLASAVPGGAGTVVEVRAVRLDESLPDAPVRLLKIDCEGLELDVLRSAAGVLDRVDRVVVEFHRHLLPNADDRVGELLQAHGFRTATRHDPYDNAIGYVYAQR
jgi:FkbM family methyltransferase